jgi:hypothetical protein
MESMLLRWQAMDGRRVGTLDTIARFVRELEPTRLVILGDPGAGKTVLLSQLAIDLVAQDPIRKKEPVPVLLSLTGWQPSDPDHMFVGDLAASLWGWVAASLSSIYGIPGPAAARLVKDGRVLPIMDGLDEMDSAADGDTERPRARAALRAINHDRSRRVVLACRTNDFGAIGTTSTGRLSGRRDIVVASATHIVVQPLEPGSVRQYVRARFPGPGRGVQRRWVSLLAAVDRREPVTRFMRSPWELFLVVTAYQGPTSEPAELLSMTADQAADRLLGALIPAVVEADTNFHMRGWNCQQVSVWLTTLARHQARLARLGASESDIQLLDLWQLAGPRGLFRSARALWPAPPPRRLTFDRLRTVTGIRRLVRAVGSGLTIGLVVGVATGFALAFEELLVSGLMFGPGLLNELLEGLLATLPMSALTGVLGGVLGLGLLNGLAAEGSTKSVKALARQSRRYDVSFGLVGGVSLALPVVLMQMSPLGIDLSIVMAVGLVSTLSIGLGIQLANRMGGVLGSC